MRLILSTLFALAALLAAGGGAAQSPRIVLFEDPALSVSRLHYPLLISGARGYRILCASQVDEEAVIRGVGFTTVPSQILTAVDPDIVAARPDENPLLCPTAADFPIKVFAHDTPDGPMHYLQFPTAIGATTTYTDRLYTPGCVGLVEALRLDLTQALNADPTPFFAGKIHEIACLSGAPVQVAPKTFAAWCMKGDRTASETATVMAMLDATPGGVSALGNQAACTAADQFLRAIPTLSLDGKGVVSTAPISVLTHLTSLSLQNNEISDIAPLTKLSAVGFLDLSGNKLSNVAAVAPLVGLTRLDLSDNAVSDVRALAALALLTDARLDGNAITDLAPLQFLQALSRLSLARNGLTGDMLEPLTALGGLTQLDLSDNAIESFAHLGEFPSTLQIDLTGNPIVASGGQSFLDICILHRDAPTPFGQTIRAIVARHGGGTCADASDALLATTTLDLSGQVISDLGPLAVLSHLTNLDLSGNAITDVAPLAGLGGLLELNLDDNAITDIRPVGPLTRLTAFTAAGNPVQVADFLSACLMRGHEGALSETRALEVSVLLDVSGVSNCQVALDTLRQLVHADVRGRGLTTIEYFSVMAGLQSIDLSDNALADVAPLAQIPGLTALWVRNNRIDSVADVSGLRRLERLSLDGNPLPSLTRITDLSKLRRLGFSNTQVRSVLPLAGLPQLEDAAMRGLDLSFGSFTEYCLVHRLDAVALGSERSFMVALDSRMEADGVDPRDCVEADAWARAQTVLTLNKKGITSVAPVAFFENLEELNLFDNLLTDAGPIASLRRLKKLSLASNRLSRLPRFASAGMTSLSLNDNAIVDMWPLQNLTQLASLGVMGNRIQDPRAIAQMGPLTSPDLRNNLIGDLGVANATLAKTPYLKGNPVCLLRISLPPLNDACRREPFVFVPGVFTHFETVREFGTVENRELNPVIINRINRNLVVNR